MNESTKFPKISIDESSLFIEFNKVKSNEVKVVDIEIILDFNTFKEVIAVEILSPKHFGGTVLFENIDFDKINSKSNMKFSYDTKADAMSFKFKKDSSLDQKAVCGKMLIDNTGHLVSIQANLLI